MCKTVKKERKRRDSEQKTDDYLRNQKQIKIQSRIKVNLKI